MTDLDVAEAVDLLGAAFRSGHPDAVLDHFASTGDVVYAGSEVGEVAVGKAALRTLLEEIFSRDERYSWRTTSVYAAGSLEQVNFVADAELFVHEATAGHDHPATEQVAYRISGVLEREGDHWRWRLCHGSEPTA